MTILNHTSDGLYNMVAILYRAVAHFGALPAEDLLARCNAGVEVIDGAPKVKHALTRWQNLGLFGATENGIVISKDYEPLPGLDDLALNEALRRAVLRLVLQEKNVGDLWATSGSPDFARGIAWLMAQDAWTSDTRVDSMLELETRQLPDVDLRAVNNSVRMRRLREWAVFLGFAWATPQTFELDPTKAVGRVLDQLLPQAGEEVRAEDFLAQLAVLLPVLDHGTYRRAVEAKLRPTVWAPTPAGWVSSTLGRALRGLQDIGVLRLVSRPDAGTSVRVPARFGASDRPWAEFSHVQRMVASR